MVQLFCHILYLYWVNFSPSVAQTSRRLPIYNPCLASPVAVGTGKATLHVLFEVHRASGTQPHSCRCSVARSKFGKDGLVFGKANGLIAMNYMRMGGLDGIVYVNSL